MIDSLATAEHLAVVSDFDGTLAAFARDAYSVSPEQRSMDALAALSQLPNTTVAVLSGRHLDGLKQVFPLREPILFGGSHGAESSWESSALTPEMEAHLAKKEAQIQEIIARHPGAELEVKPFQRVLHLRALELQDPDAAAAAYAEGVALSADGFPKTTGKCVVEFSATRATKGTWIEGLRARVGATAVVFLGDDTTDEDGFAVLNQPPDVGVKVGEGETHAQLRVPDVHAVSDFLEQLARARAAHA